LDVEGPKVAKHMIKETKIPLSIGWDITTNVGSIGVIIKHKLRIEVIL
jgi:hypothetical protein